MKTDTLLAFRDAHPEAWPRALNYDGVKDWYMVGEGPDGMAKFQFVPERVAHALVEAKVMDVMGEAGFMVGDLCRIEGSDGYSWMLTIHGNTYFAPTRLEALIEAYKAEVADG